MNKSRIKLVGLLMVVLLLALAVPAQARKAADFSVTFDLPTVDLVHYTATGTYWDFQSVLEPTTSYGEGTATIHWTPRPWAKQGTMILEDDDEASSMVIQYTFSGDAIQVDEDTYYFTGPFKILYLKAAGDYQLLGQGTMNLYATMVDGWVNSYYGTLDGWAQPLD